jgi:hypothetical protein
LRLSPFPSGGATDPMEGVVAIHDVSGEMMEAAARKAAEAADEVAHRASASVDTALDAPAASVETATEQAIVAAGAAAPMVDQASGKAVSTGTAAVADPGRAADRAPSRTMQASKDALPQAASGDGAGHAVQQGLSGAAGALVQYNAKLLEAIQANMAATGDFCTALMSAKSVPEVVVLNVDHVRRQMDVMTTQGRELASLAQKLASGAMQPLKATVAARLRGR